MSEKYKDTIDWDLYWTKETESKDMIKGARNMANRISIFIDEHEIGNIADFGCGPGTTLFILAKKYPDLNFTGFDSSVSVIKQNQLKVRKMGLRNIRFECEILPDIETKEMFDLIYCIATLYYVRDIKRAVLNLYKRVSERGFLIFNYPNRFSMFWYRNWIKSNENEKKKRFSLVLSGENLLTLREIKRVIGKRTNNFWNAVGESINKANMCIYVQKD